MILLAITAVGASAQVNETYTGTVLSFGSGMNTRTTSRTFTLIITKPTTDAKANEYLGILQESGQDAVLKAISKAEAGRFSVGPNVSIPVNVVRETTVGGQRRLFVVFERWTQFAEYRNGYRSLDYPFGVIELNIDLETGKGEGTYIAAAQIRWKTDKKSGADTVEIENFATFPARLMGVTRR